jgi:hypothetical protein
METIIIIKNNFSSLLTTQSVFETIDNVFGGLVTNELEIIWKKAAVP